MKNTFFLFLILASIVCCNHTKQENVDKTNSETSLLSKVITHPKIQPIDSAFNDESLRWETLKTVHVFLTKFEKVSPKEALTNALELRDITKSLKDSIKPVLFDTPALNARINVFYNETLRLADITFIPAATAKDINLQIDKTITTFSAINSKISTILSKKRFDEELGVDYNFIGIDSTKIDSVTRNSIGKKRKDDSMLKMQYIDNSLNKKQ